MSFSQSDRNGFEQFNSSAPIIDSSATSTSTVSQADFQSAVHASMTRAYCEMSIGIGITAATAWYSAQNDLLLSFLKKAGMGGVIGLLLVPLLICVVLHKNIMKMNTVLAYIIFYVFAGIMGFTLSAIFYQYRLQDIGIVLAMTAGLFVILAIIGLTMKTDLTSFGTIFAGALLTLVISELIIGFFMPGRTTTMVFSAIGIIIFAGLTMHDVQFCRKMFAAYANDPQKIRKVSIICALSLYLDFLNMFLRLLELFGKER
ncbi:MAG: Bax inhibitor-1/YccA family protein [Bifidobacteriaceae bacterium]|nr:Bax inhibitor-1/YccA family protein [Bifidobacteriaceae bacterium]